MPNLDDNTSVILDKASGKWLKLQPDGDPTFVSDKAEATRVDPSQLQAYIRDYELDYLSGSLVTEPAVS